MGPCWLFHRWRLKQPRPTTGPTPMWACSAPPPPGSTPSPPPPQRVLLLEHHPSILPAPEHSPDGRSPSLAGARFPRSVNVFHSMFMTPGAHSKPLPVSLRPTGLGPQCLEHPASPPSFLLFQVQDFGLKHLLGMRSLRLLSLAGENLGKLSLAVGWWGLTRRTS